MDKNEPTIPAAAKDSIPSWGMLPTMAVSVMDNSGSAMPAIVAGIARLLIVLKFITVFKKNCFTILILNNERDVRYFDKCHVQSYF